MNKMVTVDIPHQLGREGARARIEQGIGKIAASIPGSSVTEHHWEGDVMAFTIEAMGQKIAGRLDIRDYNVHAELDLPMMIALFAEKARDMLLQGGQKLLA